MTHDNTFIGIDVSKNHLDICILPLNKTKRYPNTSPGIKALLLDFVDLPSIQRIVLEPTGGYEEAVLNALAGADFPVSKINASQIRAFARASGQLAKTDKIDAHVLAEYGQKMKCRLYVPLPDSVKPLKKLVLRRKQLIHMIVEEKNRLKKEMDQMCLKLIRKTLKFLIAQKESIEKQMLSHVQKDKALSSAKDVLTSLKGIGDVTAIILMTDLPELGKVEKGQIAKLVGLAPLNRDSGLMRGKSKVYGGRDFVRDSLYLAALPAIRFDPALKAFFLRLKNNGKPGKLAVIAVAHKMLSILNARMKEFYA